MREDARRHAMTSSPHPDEPPEARTLRGAIFTDLDRLAFALEMEAAVLLEEGRERDAARRQQQRLGVRLAQRLVAGVWADEVNLRLQRWAEEYDARVGAMDGAEGRRQDAGAGVGAGRARGPRRVRA